jgi:hypothetical protein
MPPGKIYNKISNLKIDFVSREIMPEVKAEKAIIVFSWRTENQYWMGRQYMLE